MGRSVHLVVLAVVLSQSQILSDESPAADTGPAIAIEGGDVRGKPEQDLVKVTNARYFIWHDSKGWHLRTAARALTQFSGTIRLEGGSFGKLRPIGLEAKAKNPDRWAVNDERNEIRFEIHTVGSFDGFDFDVDGGNRAARVEFDLSQGRAGRRLPRRIYLGRDGKHPKKAQFECPAAPDKAANPTAENGSTSTENR